MFTEISGGPDAVTSHREHERYPHLMIFLVAALLLLGVLLGTVAHAPLSVSLVAGSAIGLWLAVFAVRERHARRRQNGC